MSERRSRESRNRRHPDFEGDRGRTRRPRRRARSEDRPPGGRSRITRPRGAIGFAFALAGFLLGCGSPSGQGIDGPPGPGSVLFEGPARGLLPHEEGQSAVFRATATIAGSTTTATFVTRIVADDGERFVVEQRAEDGARSRLHARDEGEEIRVEAVEEDDGLLRSIDPAPVLIRTPVVAGESIRGGFRRSLAVVLHGGEGDLRVVVPFEGTSERTPLDLDDRPVAGRTYPGAIRFGLSASGRASVPTNAGPIALTLEITGEETLAPAVGLVREEIDLVLRAGNGSATAHLETVRAQDP